MKVIDANGHVLGRLASTVAKRLIEGEEIAIVNAERAIVIGNKDMILSRYRKKVELNHPRKGPKFPRNPDQILKRTIRGMIPYQQPSGREAYRRLKVYMGVPPELKDRRARKVNAALKPPAVDFMHLGEISVALGARKEVFQ